MDEWIRGLPGELGYEAVWAGLILAVGWAVKSRGMLARPEPVYISAAGVGVGEGNANVVVLEGMDTDELVGTLTPNRHDPPPSAIEELFWWYMRVC